MIWLLGRSRPDLAGFHKEDKDMCFATGLGSRGR
jgi:hypothetical protein